MRCASRASVIVMAVNVITVIITDRLDRRFGLLLRPSRAQNRTTS